MGDYFIDNKQLYNYELYFLFVISWITRLTFLLFIVGVFQTKPQGIVELIFVSKICLALFLIYRFNNYRTNKIVFTELDRKVCYSSGMYIILISFMDYYNSYINSIRNTILPYTQPIVKYITTLFNNAGSDNNAGSHLF